MCPKTHDGAAQELAEASPGGEQTYRALMESTDVEQASRASCKRNTLPRRS
ncbi:hypothetical protein PI125_g20895 [Phytophthora idaei]|nr:hypothetical protein PI125_g20895 [Phytophthora idaei]KAG3133030.1 hypothetical protein PI126_g19343 [Phytophthora idaei]